MGAVVLAGWFRAQPPECVTLLGWKVNFHRICGGYSVLDK